MSLNTGPEWDAEGDPGRIRSTGRKAPLLRETHFQSSFINTGLVELGGANCTELKSVERLTSSRRRIPASIWIRSRTAGRKLGSVTRTA